MAGAGPVVLRRLPQLDKAFARHVFGVLFGPENRIRNGIQVGQIFFIYFPERALIAVAQAGHALIEATVGHLQPFRMYFPFRNKGKIYPSETDTL